MAKLKAEVEHAHHEAEGATLRDRLFANVESVSRVGSAFAPVSNWLSSVPGSGYLGEKLLGIARERDLPTFERESFDAWWADRGPLVPEREANRRALLFPDTYNNYSHPDVLKAAVEVLEAAGVHVQVTDDIGPSGRAAHSKGFLDVARERAATNVGSLAPRVADGWDVVVVEPSDAVMLQSDYLDLLGHDHDGATTLASGTFGVCEYLDRFALDSEIQWADPDETLTYHGHCHQKAVTKDHHAVGVLRRAGYAVDPLDSGCCGMAGSFGYEAEHYSMSAAIAEILFDQVRSSPGEAVVAPGASCRTQFEDGPVDTPVPHPVQKLADTAGTSEE